jgi:hypothetical protein
MQERSPTAPNTGRRDASVSVRADAVRRRSQNPIRGVLLCYMYHVCMHVCACVYTYRVSNVERSIFLEVIVSVILSKKKKRCKCTCVLFQTVSAIQLFHCTVPRLLIRKRYYVLFLFFPHWLYSPLGPWPMIFSFKIILQTVGLLGRVISSS